MNMEEGAEYAELSWISSVKHRYSRSLLHFSQYNCNKEAVVHILPYYLSLIITYIPVCNKELLLFCMERIILLKYLQI